MSDPAAPTVRDQIVAQAKDVPSLIATAKVLDPSLAQALEGKALLASKSVYGPVVAAGVAWLAGRYGLGWDDNTTALVAGLVTLAISALLRYVTTAPITSIFRKNPPA